jgi:hypothetical protein
LWTPGGEHRVPDDRGPAGGGRPPGPAGGAAAAGPDADLDDAEFDGVTEAEMRAELDEARRRLAEVPAAQVVANHAMGLFELGAIHLDAMAAVVDVVGDRLGPNAGVLRDALAQIQMAFVQVRNQADG